MITPPARRNPVREFLTGISLLGRGLGMYRSSIGLYFLGLLPALIAGLLLLVVFVLLLVYIGDLASAVTWFANGWNASLRGIARLIGGIAVIGITGLLAVVTFTSITLAIGDPFYEKISERIDQKLGDVPEPVHLPWFAELVRGIGESIRLVAISALIGVPLFLAGFIPVVGQTAVPVIGALFGGWFLTIELVGVPFARRGLKLADRRRVLRANRPLAVGFGATVFVCFLIPLGAVLVMPAAVAGGTLLARRVLPVPAATTTPQLSG